MRRGDGGRSVGPYANAGATIVHIAELEAMSVAELRTLARERNLQGVSRLPGAVSDKLEETFSAWSVLSDQTISVRARTTCTSLNPRFNALD